MSKTIQNQIKLYKSKDGSIELQVKVEEGSVWLNQEQIAHIFDVERSVVTKHINNVFKSEELPRDGVRAKFAHTAGDGKLYQVLFYNLDMVLSVGYRVNSKNATKFRQRATRILKDYALKGYALNHKKLEGERLQELSETVKFLKEIIHANTLSHEESVGMLEIVLQYTQTRTSLYQYDEKLFSGKKKTKNRNQMLDVTRAYHAVEQLKKELIQKEETTQFFAQEREQGALEGIIGNIYQTFGDKHVYPTVEEKAAHLLYFVIKDHPFVDGNKRSGAFLFLYFLDQYGLLRTSTGKLMFDDKGLVALALLVAQSNPKEKDLTVQLIMRLLF